MFTLAAAQATSRGWGGPVALLIAVAIFIACATVHYHYLERRNPSPTPRDGRRGVSVKPQVKAVSDTADTEPDTGWWGRIVEVGGRRVRAGQPGVVVVEKPTDDDLDLDLDDADDEPEPIEDVITRMEDRGLPYMEIVRHLIDEFEVSESTAKRSIREVRAERSSTV